ncbi:hypothetical protein ABTX84_19365 [Streptomyces sp. NPDC095614]|uniref:hypothetical protein n=1 Tax=Streptomyces sp. NPDC095614 TaxID=3156692 RepID=UPI0033270A69
MCPAARPSPTWPGACDEPDTQPPQPFDFNLDAVKAELADTRAKRAEAEQVVVCLDADLIERTDERDQLQAELVNVRQVLAPYLAAEATAGAVTVPEMVRDTSALEDQATAPIAVTTLREHFGGSAA